MATSKGELPKSILISAYACSMGVGSEQGAGWEFVESALSIRAKVHLITRDKYAAALQNQVDVYPNLYIHAFELGRGLIKWKRRLPFGTQLYYALWQWKSRKLIRELDEDHQFDIAQHATFAVDWLPCGLSSARSTPYIWGPVGSAAVIPLSCWRYIGVAGVFSEIARRIVSSAGYLLWGRVSAKRAQRVLAQSDETAHRYSKYSPIVAPNPFVEQQDLGEVNDRDQHLLLGVGNLIPLKGWALALRVLRELPSDYRIRILGEGSDRKRLMRLVSKLELHDRVELVGQVHRNEVLAEMSRVKWLIHLSFRDQAGWVVAEAIERGATPLTLDLGGPSVIVKHSRSWSIPIEGKDLPVLIAQNVLEERIAEPIRGMWTQEVRRKFFANILESEMYKLNRTEGSP